MVAGGQAGHHRLASPMVVVVAMSFLPLLLLSSVSLISQHVRSLTKFVVCVYHKTGEPTSLSLPYWTCEIRICERSEIKE